MDKEEVRRKRKERVEVEWKEDSEKEEEQEYERKTRTEDKDGRQYFYSRNPILDSVGGTGVQSEKICFMIGTLAEPLNKGLESLQQKEQDFTRKLSIDCLLTM